MGDVFESCCVVRMLGLKWRIGNRLGNFAFGYEDGESLSNDLSLLLLDRVSICLLELVTIYVFAFFFIASASNIFTCTDYICNFETKTPGSMNCMECFQCTDCF